MRGGLWIVAAGALAFSGCGEETAMTGQNASELPPPEPARFAKPGPAPSQEPAFERPRGAWISAAGKATRDPSRLFDGAKASGGEPSPVFHPDASSPAALKGAPVVKRAGMAIDTDGPVAGYDRRVHRDPHRQLQTSLRYADGSSVDPTRVPYIVVPISEKALLGDLAVVEYRGKRVVAVVADCGRRWGEGSVALAERLGIPSDGVSGGVSSGVTYTVYRGSGARRRTQAQVQAALASAEASLGAPIAVASL